MDWKQLINDLRECGMTQVVIASRAEVVQSVISELLSGHIKEPRHSTGERLKALHRKAMREARRKSAQESQPIARKNFPPELIGTEGAPDVAQAGQGV